MKRRLRHKGKENQAGICSWSPHLKSAQQDIAGSSRRSWTQQLWAASCASVKPRPGHLNADGFLPWERNTSHKPKHLKGKHLLLMIVLLLLSNRLGRLNKTNWKLTRCSDRTWASEKTHKLCSDLKQFNVVPRQSVITFLHIYNMHMWVDKFWLITRFTSETEKMIKKKPWITSYNIVHHNGTSFLTLQLVILQLK